MKTKIIFCFTLLFNCFLFSQSEIYIDENMKEIDSLVYKRKCKIRVLKCLLFKTDSLRLNKIVKRYEFNKVTKLEYKQVLNFLATKNNSQIDTTATLIIKYQDSLFDFETRLKNYKKHIKIHNLANHRPFNFKTFDAQRKKWKKTQLKCINKLQKKYNTEVYYVFKHDYGAIKDFPELNWVKDRGMFKNTFFKIMYNNNLLILKPNGEYFLSGGHLDTKMLHKLMKNNDWNQYNLDWENSYKLRSETGKGLFKSSFHHKSHCF